MKSCPTCKRTYSDDTISFCLIDGMVLSAPYDPHATQRLQINRDSKSQTTERLPAGSEDQQPLKLKSTISASPTLYPAVERKDPKPNAMRWLFIVAVGLVLMTTTTLLIKNAFRKTSPASANKDIASSGTSNPSPFAAPNQATASREPSPRSISDQSDKVPLSSVTPAAPSLIGTSWKSSSGSRIRFNSNNHFSGTNDEGNPMSGSWRQQGDRLHISFRFDDGALVTGTGTINGDRITMNVRGLEDSRVQRATSTLTRIK